MKNKEKNYKPFSHPRWNDPGVYETVGKAKVTYEERKRGLDAMLETKMINKELYEKWLKELNEEYNIKN